MLANRRFACSIDVTAAYLGVFSVKGLLGLGCMLGSEGGVPLQYLDFPQWMQPEKKARCNDDRARYAFARLLGYEIKNLSSCIKWYWPRP